MADRAHVFATTVRKRGVTKPVVTPEAAAVAIRAEPGGSAILFGPERSGLETDDVALARTIVTVPINPEFGSLNLAQAVILVAYEWSKAPGARLAARQVELDPPAPQFELEGMIGQLETMLVGDGLLLPASSHAHHQAHVAHASHQARLDGAGGPHGPRRTLDAGTPTSALTPVEAFQLILDREFDEALPQFGNGRTRRSQPLGFSRGIGDHLALSRLGEHARARA